MSAPSLPNRRVRAVRHLLAAAVLAAAPLSAAERSVRPADGDGALAAALAAAAPGDVVRLVGGVWPGPLLIDRPLTLAGEDGPVIDGGGRGTVITVTAPGVELRGLTIRGSGASLDQENSGIAVEAAGVVVRDNRLEDVLFGIYLRDAAGSTVAGNYVTGKPLALPRRGDAIRVWHSDGVELRDNRIAASRDVVLWYSSRLTVRGNEVRDGRYGLHFMYCDDARIEANLLYANSVGAFLMYSRRLRLAGNSIAGNHGPSGYGVGLKDMDDAELTGNLLAGNRVGVFLDNSPRETGSSTRIAGNVLAGNDTGIFLLPNVRRAEVTGNDLVENGEQVGIGGGGGDPGANLWRGNFWSDYAGFDADGDGRGDLPYRAERLFESLADARPVLRLFRHAPAAEAVDFAARAFPAVRPQPKLADAEPRMRPLALALVPPLPHGARGGWSRAAAGLLAGALLVLAVPRPRPRRRVAPPARPAGEPRAPLVEMRGVSRRFGRQLALDGVDLEVERGEALALWGPNGAGKTTLLRAVLGVLPCDGQIAVLGLDPRRRGKAVRRLIGYLPQEIALQGELSVEETLRFFARLRGAAAERVEELLGWLELDEHRGKPVAALSGGLKQRLALGIALVADPPLLLLDEPTANLDPAARTSFSQLLLGLKQTGKTLVFTSHRGAEVRALADRVAVLQRGRLVAVSPAAEAALAPPRSELRLVVAAADRAAAAGLLLEAGFGPRRLGPILSVTVPAGRKLEPLVLVLDAGLEVEDLEIEPLESESPDA